MSLTQKYKTQCKNCGNFVDLEFYNSVNVTIDKELIGKVRNREINNFECKKCGIKSELVFKFLFVDMDKNIWVWCFPDTQKINKEQIKKDLSNSKIPSNMFETVGSKEPKFVFGYNELFDFLGSKGAFEYLDAKTFVKKYTINPETLIKNVKKQETINSNNPKEGFIYSLNNNYLTSEQKQEVELWYQLPGNIMQWIYSLVAIYSIYYSLSLKEVFGITILTSIIGGVCNWYFYNKKFIYKLYLTIFHSWTLYLLGFSVAIFLFLKGAILLAIISLIFPFGLLSIIDPSIIIYTFLARKYKMHQKYAFFKKEYNLTFPFEKDLN